MTAPIDKAAACGPAPKIANRPQFPFLDLRAQFATIEREILAAVQHVLDAQHFILGPEVEQFEADVARLVGTKFAVGCASGSDALLLALMALGIGPGDEVITTPFTFVATAGAIARAGARPVFADIDPVTYNILPANILHAITSHTRAVIPVHLFGQPAAMDQIMHAAESCGIAVIEDAAQAIGARFGTKAAGSIGDIGCFSFFPSKNLGGAGDGGMLTTNSEALADCLKLLRVHGSRTKYDYEILGVNSRLDALQAAILNVKLRHLPAWTEARRQNADRYRTLLLAAGLEQYVSLPSEAPANFHVYNQYVIRVAERDGLRRHLQDAGIPCEIYYPSPLHLQPAFKYLGYGSGDFPQAEAACREVLALPIFPELTESQQHSVVGAIANFFGKVLYSGSRSACTEDQG